MWLVMATYVCLLAKIFKKVTDSTLLGTAVSWVCLRTEDKQRLRGSLTAIQVPLRAKELFT